MGDNDTARLNPSRRFLGYSGGKDSTALYLLLLERGKPFTPIFADTQNEATETYDYIRQLPERTGGPAIQWIKADFSERLARKRHNLPKKWRRDGIAENLIDQALELLHPTGNVYLDLCLLKGRFPSSQAQFCTYELKIEPKYALYQKIGGRIFDYAGVRREESVARRNYPVRAWRYGAGRRKPLAMIYPLVEWTLADVMDIHARHGLRPNPLYERGAARVGCWPCINCRKAELHTIAASDPSAIDRIREWENIVSQTSRRGSATFFPVRNLGLPDPIRHNSHGIDAQVEWSRTAKGRPRQFRFTELDENENAVMEEFVTACDIWGQCE